MNGYVRLTAILPFAPYCYYESEISEVFDDPDFKINEPQSVTINGRKLTKVSFENLKGKQAIGVGWFAFEPRSFALCEYAVGLRGKFPAAARRAIVEYEGVQDGVPLIKKVTLCKEKNGVRSLMTTDQVLELRKEDVPEDEFRLSAFGLPDHAARLVEEKPTPWFLYIALTAGGLALVGMFFFRRARKAREAQAG